MADTTNRATNPVAASPNRLKLAVFGLNVSGGCSMTSVPGTVAVEWDESVRIARKADAAGIEALVPVARWRGMGGEVNFNHRSFEPLTWAAGLAGVTENIAVFATIHVPTAHPVRVAKEVATVDHISGGRFCLNIVAGWNETEISMFGAGQRPHDERYEVADDWIGLCRALWTNDGSFDWDGPYFTSPNSYSEPKPVQRPSPVIMSAGNSERGQHFAARHADLNYVVAPDIATAGTLAASVKDLARETYDRDIQVFGHGHIVCAQTEAEAKRFLDHYVNEKGDWEGVRNLLDVLIPNSQSALGDQWEAMAANMITGYAGIPLVGTPEQVVEGMVAFADAGLDGISISWVDYDEGLDHFGEVLLPLMVSAGLREG